MYMSLSQVRAREPMQKKRYRGGGCGIKEGLFTREGRGGGTRRGVLICGV